MPKDKSRSVPQKSGSKKEGPQVPQTFPIVGVGASAGGLEPLRMLLTALPPDLGMAFVLVQHLDPKHESQLAKLLSACTQMPVLEVKASTPIEPNHVYVIS